MENTAKSVCRGREAMFVCVCVLACSWTRACVEQCVREREKVRGLMFVYELVASCKSVCSYLWTLCAHVRAERWAYARMKPRGLHRRWMQQSDSWRWLRVGWASRNAAIYTPACTLSRPDSWKQNPAKQNKNMVVAREGDEQTPLVNLNLLGSLLLQKQVRNKAIGL